MLRLYADECVDARLIVALRAQGVDIVSAGEFALLGSPDERHLAAASELDRVLVSADQDFLSLVHERLQSGIGLPGLIFILPGRPFGQILRALELATAILEPADMRDRIEWVP